MFTQVSLERLSVGSIYKLVFIGSTCSLMPLTLVLGVLALFGFSTVSWNGHPVYGLNGMLFSPLIGAALTVFITAFLGTAFIFGLWLFSKVRPLSLSVKNLAHDPGNVA